MILSGYVPGCVVIKQKSGPFTPNISVQLTTFNERKIISHRIKYVAVVLLVWPSFLNPGFGELIFRAVFWPFLIDPLLECLCYITQKLQTQKC